MPPPPPIDETFWAEWRFRSNCPIQPTFTFNDAEMTFHYSQVHGGVAMYGDTVVNDSGNFSVTNLAIDEFHTYRFESLDGTSYSVAVDGHVFVEGVRFNNLLGAFLSMRGSGGCFPMVDIVNEWDFVRYGTIDSGEQVVSSDPPAGVLNSQVFPGLDRFMVTFDSSNYVYTDEITVGVSGGPAIVPNVIQTRRRENTDPDTVEIVLDRPMPIDRTTTFTFNTGLPADCSADPPVNCVKYTLTDLGPPATCGDGALNQPTEECDGSDDTACPGACRDDCTCGFCGDSILDPTEQCDNGPSNSDTMPDACRTSCALPTCGDNVTDEGEECDGTSDEACPGNPVTPGGQCLPDCTCEIPGIPTLSHWGLLIMAVVLVAMGKRSFARPIA